MTFEFLTSDALKGNQWLGTLQVAEAGSPLHRRLVKTDEAGDKEEVVFRRVAVAVVRFDHNGN